MFLRFLRASGLRRHVAMWRRRAWQPSDLGYSSRLLCGMRTSCVKTLRYVAGCQRTPSHESSVAVRSTYASALIRSALDGLASARDPPNNLRSTFSCRSAARSRDVSTRWRGMFVGVKLIMIICYHANSRDSSCCPSGHIVAHLRNQSEENLGKF